MEETNITIKVKCRNAQNTVLRNISIKQKIEILLEQLSSISGIPKDRMTLLKGFPPKRVSYSPGNLIESMGLERQDTLIVELDSSGEAQFSSTSASEVASPPSKAFPDNAPTMIGNLRGTLIRKIVPSDNSCLFTSVAFALSDKLKASQQPSESLRMLVSTKIASDTKKFSKAFLGRTNADYVQWILKSQSWGGGIELSILAEFYGVEISVVDIQSVNISRFGEDKSYSSRIYLIYDGLHYDPLYFQPSNELRYQTVFSTADLTVHKKVLELAREAHADHLFTDLNNFTIKCNDCNEYFRGQEEAKLHAKVTQHTDFVETK